MIIPATEARKKTVTTNKAEELKTMVANKIKQSTNSGLYEARVKSTEFSAEVIDNVMRILDKEGYEVYLEIHELEGLFSFPGDLIISWQ